MHDIPALFAQYGWPCAVVEPGVWQSAVVGADGEQIALYVRAEEDWVQFVVSPLVPAQPGTGDAAGGMHAALLRLNQDLRLARLALDTDGDVNLLADLPASGLSAATFRQALELLAFYADELGPQLRRLLVDPQFPFPPDE